ncbi:uncharacterized protein A4U43_C03F22190 [Asparagus officinalis]|uniref:Uncharacterized protein n=1 Tax=Asparagus officinalis TaxID=4686 RepID=A0A5P1FCW2_ASPOF|nr:uncharacterized protein A4U43_C03F22190 [Asparagus officinalis]
MLTSTRAPPRSASASFSPLLHPLFGTPAHPVGRQLPRPPRSTALATSPIHAFSPGRAALLPPPPSPTTPTNRSLSLTWPPTLRPSSPSPPPPASRSVVVRPSPSRRSRELVAVDEPQTLSPSSELPPALSRQARRSLP